MAILEVAIESQQWRVKAQAARAMGTVATKLGPGLPQREQKLLLTILINALAGRTWYQINVTTCYCQAVMITNLLNLCTQTDTIGIKKG